MDMEALRQRAGLTREDIAKGLEVSETSVRNWETGRTEPTMTPTKYLEALNLLQCSPEEFAAAAEKSLNQRLKRKPGRPKKKVSNLKG